MNIFILGNEQELTTIFKPHIYHVMPSEPSDSAQQQRMTQGDKSSVCTMNARPQRVAQGMG